MDSSDGCTLLLLFLRDQNHCFRRLSIEANQALTNNPHVRRFKQGDAEIILQNQLPAQAILIIFASAILAPIFLVLERKFLKKC